MDVEEGEYYSPSELLSCINSGGSSLLKRKMMNKKRFSDEQVKSLESIFENETKLEPNKKVQVARELGLQPRQVAIWFQNKRARFKSKQLERDYSLLRANYNSLSSHFDTLKKEKHSLLSQLQKLRKDLEVSAGNTSNDESQSEKEKSESENTNKTDQFEEKPALSVEGSEFGASILSDEGSSENTNYFRVEGETDPDHDMDILAMVQTVAGGLTSSETWDDLRVPEGLFDQALPQGPDSNCQWWNFWS